MRAVKNRLLQCHVVTCLVSKLATRTGNVVGVCQVPVAIDQEQSSSQSSSERVLSIHTQHQVWREIGAPRARIGEIVLSIQGVISDETAEDSAL